MRRMEPVHGCWEVALAKALHHLQLYVGRIDVAHPQRNVE